MKYYVTIPGYDLIPGDAEEVDVTESITKYAELVEEHLTQIGWDVFVDVSFSIYTPHITSTAGLKGGDRWVDYEEIELDVETAEEAVYSEFDWVVYLDPEEE